MPFYAYEEDLRLSMSPGLSPWDSFDAIGRPSLRQGRPADRVEAEGDASGGAGRDRTGDPLVANQVLSQLSYSPTFAMGAAGCSHRYFTMRRNDAAIATG